MPRQIEAERVTAAERQRLGATRSAGCMAPLAGLPGATGTRLSMGNTLRQRRLPRKREIAALARMARETMGAIE